MNKKGTESGFYLARGISNDYEANFKIDNKQEGETTSQSKIFHL
jgi:hypothetical protein